MNAEPYPSEDPRPAALAGLQSPDAPPSQSSTATASTLGTLSDALPTRPNVTGREAVLEAFSEARSEFVANLVHEIRAPLNEILGLVRLALDTNLEAQPRRHLNTVIATADALLTRLNEIQIANSSGDHPESRSAAREETERVFMVLAELGKAGIEPLIGHPMSHGAKETSSDRHPSPQEESPTNVAPILAETAEVFCESAPLLHRKLCEAAAAGNLEVVRFTANSLKGSIAVFQGVAGAAECHRKVQEIEEFAALELLGQVQGLTLLLEPYFGLLLHHLDEIIHPPRRSRRDGV